MLSIINRMVKRFFFLTVLLAVTAAAKAQIGDYRNEFAVGVNGGYVFSNIGFTPTVPQSQHTGLT